MLSSSRLFPNFSCSVISGNPRTFFAEIPIIETSGIGSFHFDMMDGDFVPRLGLYPEVLREIKAVSVLPIHVHLMMRNPEREISRLIGLGAASITSHIEPLEHVHYFLQGIREMNCSVGLAINPGTPTSFLEPVLDNLDSITIMAINPGIVGHKFIDSTLKRIQEIRSLVQQSGRVIELVVDGGVIPENARQIFNAGADTLICGAGTIFAPGDSIENNMRKLREKFAFDEN